MNNHIAALTDCTFDVRWSEEDKEWVGLCEEFPSLSWLDKKRALALEGIQELVLEVLADLSNEEVEELDFRTGDDR